MLHEPKGEMVFCKAAGIADQLRVPAPAGRIQPLVVPLANGHVGIRTKINGDCLTHIPTIDEYFK